MINVVFNPKHVTVSGNIIPFVHINPIPFVGNNLLDRNHILIKQDSIISLMHISISESFFFMAVLLLYCSWKSRIIKHFRVGEQRKMSLWYLIQKSFFLTSPFIGPFLEYMTRKQTWRLINMISIQPEVDLIVWLIVCRWTLLRSRVFSSSNMEILPNMKFSVKSIYSVFHRYMQLLL